MEGLREDFTTKSALDLSMTSTYSRVVEVPDRTSSTERILDQVCAWWMMSWLGPKTVREAEPSYPPPDCSARSWVASSLHLQLLAAHVEVLEEAAITKMELLRPDAKSLSFLLLLLVQRRSAH